MSEPDAIFLKNQLKIARNEINKLRQHLKTFSHFHKNEIEKIQTQLSKFRCEGCINSEEENKKQNEIIKEVDKNVNDTIKFKPIGIISSMFPEKRGVPRQATTGQHLNACIKLNAEIFNNPEHSIKGLEEYSHMWIIYFFHRNTSHSKAKITPPRLNGEKIGVFCTRSPHRPCPIGLSLVEILKVEKSTIHFKGTDMVDGTPVLDIKPFIPFYDSPFSFNTEASSLCSQDSFELRQEPDGEESEQSLGAIALPSKASIYTNAIKVPNWVATNRKLGVKFNERAEAQIKELEIDKKSIINILEADPRSVYLRTKHGSQIFTFQLVEATVTCKFDDNNCSVTVIQLRKTENIQGN